MSGQKKAKARNKKESQFVAVMKRLKRNRFAMIGLFVIIFLLLVAAFADVLAPYGYAEQDLANTFQSPSWEHPCGTDKLGRDIFSRVVYGARISIWAGVISVGISFCIGVPLGGIAGYYGGAIGNVIMRVMDGLSAFPSLVLAITLAVSMGRGTVSAMVAVGIVSIPDYARLMFAQTSSIKAMPYIEAGRAVGLKTSSLILKHIFPNCLSQLLVRATLGLGMAILTVSSLSFLGLGVQPPTAEWGAMISDGRRYIVSGEWWITTFPGLAIMTSILGFNLVGDGVRDILDPRNRTGS